MTTEVNYSGKEEKFSTIEEAKEFANNLTDGYDIWENGNLIKSVVKNFKTGEVKVTNYS